ncbi:hypothetical protein FRC15_009315 [Serendipita sp. 397]|nr:hypothetical protein FRC15_009315 [Serendipita sp. 397]KAG8802882.1 hypothetical protein FRC16_008492 [Serendipita sp. 398]
MLLNGGKGWENNPTPHPTQRRAPQPRNSQQIPPAPQAPALVRQGSKQRKSNGMAIAGGGPATPSSAGAHVAVPAPSPKPGYNRQSSYQMTGGGGTVGTHPYSNTAIRAPSDFVGGTTVDGSYAYGRQSPMVASGVSPRFTNVHATGIPDSRAQEQQPLNEPPTQKGGFWSMFGCRC